MAVRRWYTIGRSPIRLDFCSFRLARAVNVVLSLCLCRYPLPSIQKSCGQEEVWHGALRTSRHDKLGSIGLMYY